jgi:hypothetical protein
MMTRDEFNKVFNLLCTNYPNTKNPNELGSLYFLALGNELTAKEFMNATLKIIKTSKEKFMPQIAEILEYAKNRNVENQVILAKKMLIEAIHKYGKSGMINFEDKGIHAVIDFIGWKRLCAMKDDEFDNFLKWEFDGIYKEFIKNPYETNDYYTGNYKIIGQKNPTRITYESIGVKNTQNLEFIPLEYKNTPQIENKVDLSELKNKMLIGV